MAPARIHDYGRMLVSSKNKDRVQMKASHIPNHACMAVHAVFSPKIPAPFVKTVSALRLAPHELRQRSVRHDVKADTALGID
jgi:hypothetical protein